MEKYSNVNVNLEELKESTGFRNPGDVDEKIDYIFNPQKTDESRLDESSKFSKSNYVLTHNPNGSVEGQKQGLLILAADTNMAFYDWDMIYRMYRLNARHEQEQNRLARRTKNQRKEDCVNEILLHEQGKFDNDRMTTVDRMRFELYKKILNKITEKKKLLDWLYKENHIGITEENKDEYIDIIGFEPYDGGVYNDNKKWKENKDEGAILREAYKEAKMFIKYKKEIGETVDWVFDYEKCKKDFIEEFGQDLTEDEKSIITPEFCERLIHIYIIPYLGKMRNAKKMSANLRRNKKDVINNIKEQEEIVIEHLKRGVSNATENFRCDMIGESKKLNQVVEKATENLEKDVENLIKSLKNDTDQIIKKLEYNTEEVENIKENVENLCIEWEENVKKAIENLEKDIEKASEDIRKDAEKTAKKMRRHVKIANEALDHSIKIFAMNIEDEVERLIPIKKEDKDRKINNFSIFLGRYNKLNLLCKLFEKSKKNDDNLKNSYEELISYLISKSKNKEPHWGAVRCTWVKAGADEEADADEENIKKVKKSIREFFDCLAANKELDEKNFNIVENRVRWIDINVPIVSDKPMFLIGMVMRFGPNFRPNKKLSEEIEGLFKLCAFYEEYKKSEKVLYGKLRYELIRLLDKFHDIYDLNIDERVRSWNDFFCYEGRTILSNNEVAFWREYLGDKYDKLPAIGFQLYFVDCVESCMPIYRWYLRTYRTIRGAIQEYMDCVKDKIFFYDEENEEVVEAINKCKMIDMEITKGKNITKIFREVWSDPYYDPHWCYDVLKYYLKCFLDCSVMKELPNERCRVLELEVILRTYQNRQAKNKMYKWFKEIYGCSLDHIVNAAKDSAKRQAVHEGF